MYQRLGRYSVERKLADGGMGSVFLGSAPDGRRVVLKVPHAQDRDSALALIDEARAGMRLKHPAIVETLDCFVDNGVSVLVVAYIEGSSLFELRKKAGALPAAAVAEMGAQLASALDVIHNAVDEHGKRLNMLHRDVSPNNVLVDVEGQSRLIDLGIVRSTERKSAATMQGMVKGTLRYLAPEILNGADHSAATDLWALGVTLYEAAIGHYTIPGDELATVRAVMDGSLFRTVAQNDENLDGALAEVLGVLVCPDDQRMRNARAAAAILDRLAMKLQDGRALLGQAARLQPSSKPSSSSSSHPSSPPSRFAEIADATEITSRNVVSPEVTAPTMLSSRGDVESVFTSNHSRAEVAPVAVAAPVARVAPVARAAPASAGLPTMQIPAAQLPRPATKPAPAPAPLPPLPPSPARSTSTAPPPPAAMAKSAPAPATIPPIDQAPTIQMPAVAISTFETAPTIQMGVWQPPPSGSPQMTPAPHLTSADAAAAAAAATRLALPITDPILPSPGPIPPPQAIEAPPTAPKPQQSKGPTQSLFLPIVVVDEDGDEVE